MINKDVYEFELSDGSKGKTSFTKKEHESLFRKGIKTLKWKIIKGDEDETRFDYSQEKVSLTDFFILFPYLLFSLIVIYPLQLLIEKIKGEEE